jgi:glycosyltransferase involved in cell wall biosynthesis
MTECRQPLVSIIIPVYNGSNYLREAIDSALAQTYPRTEILVINDGSSDGGATEEIALSYGDRIRYLKKENGGVSTALNLGIREMRGEYFSWLSHDDLYAPEKVAAEIELLLKYPEETDLIALSADRQIDGKGEMLGAKRSFPFAEGEITVAEEALASLLQRTVFHGCALLIPRTVFDRLGGFDETMRYSQDLLMWLRIFLAGYRLVYTDEPLVYGRVHGGQLTQTGRAIFYRDCRSMAEQLGKELCNMSSDAYNFLYCFAKYCAKYHATEAAEHCIRLGRERGLLPRVKLLSLRFAMLYGSIRPLIRRIYYRLFKKVKTK